MTTPQLFSLCQPFFLENAGEIKVNGGICLIEASLETLKNNMDTFLHVDEKLYFNKLSYEKRQLSYLLGRLAAKKSIDVICEIKPTKICIKPGIFQQPIVYGEKVRVSYSHASQFATAIAFPDSHPMGIDLECIDNKKLPLITTQLTSSEKELINISQSVPSEKIITLLWTMKEALSKALCTGMMTSFELYSIVNLKKQGELWTNEFNHFGQYQALSFFLGSNLACSIVYPKNTTILIDIPFLQKHFEER